MASDSYSILLVFLGSSYILGGSADDSEEDFFAIIGRWISNASIAVVNWFKRVFADAASWVRDKVPVVVGWLSKAWGWVRDTAFPVVVLWSSEAGAAVDLYLQQHQIVALIAAGAIFLGPEIILLPLVLLQCILYLFLVIIGFGVNGVVGGSMAAQYQSYCYGGYTPAHSMFAIFQSIGMKYQMVTLSSYIFATFRLLAGVVFIYVILGMTMLW
ncbi:hypothetical protein GGX14DRAFT_444968 [Mycena pura]|uniref:Uncharacterized protein n=1 Tax=Mycena pura TaxID=153505 RepID=A0AAD6YDX9_9AGAR|nr:hypothetical protein GGX14DRAFT_444968 [Mycena pura]